MMNGTDYENTSPTRDDVLSDLKILYPDNEETINYVITQYLNKNKSFGSYRGYATFCRKDLIEQINLKLK